MDIFYFFFHLAIDLGKDKASIAFVTTNYYPTATGARKLRQDFKQRTVIKNLINLNELKIFESAQGQHNMITILQKGHDLLTNAKTAITRREGYEKPEILTSILNGGDEETDYFQVSQENLYENDDCHMRLSFKKVNVLLDKIQSESFPLYKICDVNKGIETGANEVFIFNSLPLFYQSLNEKERALIKPFYKNSDISRYHFKKSSKHILYFPNNINIEDYPTISKYLKENKKVLSERAHIKRSSQAWYTLLWPRDSKLFEQAPKIITSYRPQTNSFCYTENQFYSGTDTYYIVNPKGYTLKFILGIINSRLALTWLKEKGKLKGSVLEMTGDVIEQIIIPRIETDNKKKISTQIEMFVQNILFITNDDNYLQNPTKQVQVKDYEKQIDQLIYKLYGFTPEEIEIMKGRRL